MNDFYNMDTNTFRYPELEEAIAKHPAIGTFYSLKQEYNDEIMGFYNFSSDIKMHELEIIGEKAEELEKIEESLFNKVRGQIISEKEDNFGNLMNSADNKLSGASKQKILVIYTKDEILHQDNLLINNLKNVIEADNLSITDKLNYINTLYNIVKSDNYKSFILDNADLIKNGNITELNKKFGDFKLQQQRRNENKIIPKAQNEKVKKTKNFFGKAK